MRFLNPVAALIPALLFTALSATTSIAAETLWPWLPGAEGTTVKGNSKKVALQIKGSGVIQCQESSVSAKEGEITTEKTLALAKILVGRCTVAGIGINSLGDAAGTILVHLVIHDCLISAGRLGWLIKPLPIHLEVPAAKLLITIEGALIAEIAPPNKKTKAFSIAVTQKEGQQTIEKCEGGGAQTLKTALDGGAFTQSGLEVQEGKGEFETVEEEAMA
jgi:hypothetical protein